VAYSIGNCTLMVGASIGIAIIPDDGKSVGDFVRAADAGMYSDKQKRNSGSLFG
jgi:predicted signal transduction protein with EAL and GGDEF domain